MTEIVYIGVRTALPKGMFEPWGYFIPALRLRFELQEPSIASVKRIVRAYLRYKDIDATKLENASGEPRCYLERHMYPARIFVSCREIREDF